MRTRAVHEGAAGEATRALGAIGVYMLAMLVAFGGSACSLVSPAGVSEPPAAVRAFEAPPALGVVLVKVSGALRPGAAALVRRAVESTGSPEAPEAAALVIQLDTLGGRVDSAVQIRDALLDSPVPVVVYVRTHATGAGVLVAYAADHIVFAPAATMGAAAPVEVSGGADTSLGEKATSFLRAELRATAEVKGRRPDLAEAMVERSLVVAGVVDAQTLLTLTTSEARALGVADSVADDIEGLLVELGLGAAEVREVELTWAENLADWLTAPAVATLLLALGLLGFGVEIKAPGLGLPGALGVLLLTAFFFGHLVVHLAGWEEVVLVAIGVILLVVEVLVVPGFGVPGVLGMLSLAAGFMMALVGLPLGESFETGMLNEAALSVLISVALSFAALFLVSRALPERALPDWLVLRTAIVARSGVADRQVAGAGRRSELVGQTGVATTDLRPSGRVRVEAEVLDVVSQSDWIARGTPVRVIEVEGVRIVVEALRAGSGAHARTEAAPLEPTLEKPPA